MSTSRRLPAASRPPAKVRTARCGTFWATPTIPKSHSENCFLFETYDPPGAFVPPHVYPTQDEFIYMLEGTLRSTISTAKWVKAGPGRSGAHANGPAARLLQQDDKADARALLGHAGAQTEGLVRSVAQSRRRRGSRCGRSAAHEVDLPAAAAACRGRRRASGALFSCVDCIYIRGHEAPMNVQLPTNDGQLGVPRLGRGTRGTL